MLFTFILIVEAIVAAALVAVILMQRSEGGGLGVGGSPSGLMSARGAADFLTRATAILATLFVLLSILLAGLATVERAPATIDPNLARQRPAGPAIPGQAPLSTGIPATGDPLAGAAEQAAGANAAAPAARVPAPAPQQAPSNGAVPLAQ
jgi:preprotein translocase subunit SecG